MPTNSSETAAQEVPDEWDFYLCEVDGEAASIFLNFWFRDQAPINSADYLYWCQIEMLDPGDHGMGIGSDAEALGEIEHAVAKKAGAAGFYFAGRMRGNGKWQLFFYGREGLESSLRSIVDTSILSSSDREFLVDSKPDPDWSGYFEFLYPNAERWQWISDGRLVESLQSHGDPLTKPRRIDHWIYFENPYNRDEFIKIAASQGFELQHAADDSAGERPCSAQVFRVDSVQHEDIHAVVMSLIEIVTELDGEYDGWETSVERQ